jgi:hypothetical protein
MIDIPFPTDQQHFKSFDGKTATDVVPLEQTFNKPWLRQLEVATTEIALRIWIVDSSDSMNMCDRFRILNSFSPNVERNKKSLCSRWNELIDTVFYHAQLATSLKAPTIFHIASSYPSVNEEYHIGSEEAYRQGNAQQALYHMETCLHSIEPNGKTVLTESISKILPYILSMKKSLRTSGQSVTLILATDCIPSDNDSKTGHNQTDLFIHTLKILDNLPVALIIRLSTNNEQVKNVSINLFRISFVCYCHLSLSISDDFSPFFYDCA